MTRFSMNSFYFKIYNQVELNFLIFGTDKKTKLKNFTFLVGDEGGMVLKSMRLTFSQKNHPPYPGDEGGWFLGVTNVAFRIA